MDIRGRGVLPKPQSRLTFETPKSVNGNGGCNRFFGPVEIDGETIAFGPLAATRMACAPAVDDQEQTFFAALADARRCSLDPQGLFVLYDATNEPILRFSRSSD
jgi:heat shock protein HslJ